MLAEILPFIDKLSHQQTSDLLTAFNSNAEVHNSFGFNGNKPTLFGQGLPHHLTRLTGNKYGFSQLGKIEIIP